MRRFFIDKLVAWMKKPNRKPLVLSGARQVGKTWILQEFGRTHFDKVAYVNFDRNDPLKSAFKGRFDINRVLTALNAESQVVITPGDTLIILDEIQTCAEALTSLKYWNEQANEFVVAAAGSLIGLAMQEGTGYPVGKTNALTLYPMTFAEFLDATGNGSLLPIINSADPALVNAFSERLASCLAEYFFVGGMPAAVSAFARTRSLDAAREEQLDILSDYARDFAKHASKMMLPRMNAVWNSLPRQLARTDRRFIASDVLKLNGEKMRMRDLHDPFEWLEAAGLVYRVWNITKPSIPFEAYRNHVFKLFSVDVGLLGAQSHLQSRTVLNQSELFSEFKGALTEQFVQQELRASASLTPYYWTSEGSRCEVDLLFELDGGIVPVEVKASTNLRSKSLKAFRDRYSVPLSLRTSLSGLQFSDWLLNVPLFQIGNVKMLISSLCASP